jgi:hypothetical protein
LTHFIVRRLRPAARTMARPVCGRTTTLTTTAHSCLIPTDTTSRRSATRRPDHRGGARPQFA